MNKFKRKRETKQKSNRRWIAGIVALIAIAVMAALGFERTSSQTAAAPAVNTPFNGDRAFADLTKIVGFGPRPAGSPALARERAYIVAELEKAGLHPQLDNFDAHTPKGIIKMTNIRAIRPGAKSATIVLCGHYDTKLFDFPFVGADDGGSSAAWVLEMARATAKLKLENSLEFVFFDGEEALLDWTDQDSVYGARNDVDRRYKAGGLKDLKALILVDMIGDKNLDIKKEMGSTSWLSTAIWNTAHSLGFDKEFLNEPIQVEDDHIPFLRAGVPSVDIIDLDYPDWHKASDTLDKTSARSLKVVGDVIYTALPEIDKRP